jgi:uncharacterized protein YqeY
MSLKEQLAADLTDAIRQRDEARKTAIRMVLWALKNAEVEAGKPLEDAAVLSIIAKEVKTRHESVDQFKKGDRGDLVAKEEAEIKVLVPYLPPAMSREELVEEATKVIAEIGAQGPNDKGKVMKALMPRLAGRADGRAANEAVTELLGGASN